MQTFWWLMSIPYSQYSRLVQHLSYTPPLKLNLEKSEVCWFGVPLKTKFVIQFWYSIFDVDIHYFILISNFDIEYLMMTLIISFLYSTSIFNIWCWYSLCNSILWYAIWNCDFEVFVAPCNTISLKGLTKVFFVTLRTKGDGGILIPHPC